MHAFAFVSPFVTEYAKKRSVNMIETALPHLGEEHHESVFALTEWLTQLFSNKPREYNKTLWTHVDEQFPLISKQANDLLYDLYYGVHVPWEGLNYTGNLEAFEFPSKIKGGTRRTLNRRKLSSR